MIRRLTARKIAGRKLEDLLIAATAQDSVIRVLHYDAHFDVILEHTTLSYESVWLAPQGSLA